MKLSQFWNWWWEMWKYAVIVLKSFSIYVICCSLSLSQVKSKYKCLLDLLIDKDRTSLLSIWSSIASCLGANVAVVNYWIKTLARSTCELKSLILKYKIKYNLPQNTILNLTWAHWINPLQLSGSGKVPSCFLQSTTLFTPKFGSDSPLPWFESRPNHFKCF